MISAFHSESSDARSTLTGKIVLCSLGKHTILKVPLSSQWCERVPGNFKVGGRPEMDMYPIQGGV